MDESAPVRYVLTEQLEGPGGRATRIPLPDGSTTAVLDVWLLHLPDNPVQPLPWSYYVLLVLAIGPDEQRQCPLAEYAVQFSALEGEPDLADVDGWEPLGPPNVRQRLHGVDRAHAREVCRSLAMLLVNRALPPEVSVYVNIDGEAAEVAIPHGQVVWQAAINAAVRYANEGSA